MGELFFGRKEELNRFRKDVFFVEEGSFGCCYSLIGLNGIGKTALIRKLAEEFAANPPEKTFYFPTIMSDGTTFWSYWIRLICQFSKRITEKVLRSSVTVPNDATDNAINSLLEIYQFFNEVLRLDPAPFKSQLILYLDAIFEYYTELGIRIIITIDEFDVAAKVFPEDGQFFQRLFSLTPKGCTSRYNLSIITISRRRASTIATVKLMQDGSNFEDAYLPIALKGFTDEDLEEYFDSYRNLPCGALSEEAKKQILYLCGRSPGMLMNMRHEISLLDTPVTDISEIYSEHGHFVKTAYRRMIDLMQDSPISAWDKRPLMHVFLQRFIGPVCDDNFSVELPLLYDHGFVMKSTASGNIFARAGMPNPHADEPADKAVFEPIAPYFIEYIKYFVLPSDLEGLSALLVRAEKTVREVIQKELSAIYPNWESVVNNYALKKDSFLETLETRALQNDFSASSISKLNVISFQEYYSIISDHWAQFSKYFSSPSSNPPYSDRDSLQHDMKLLNKARNDSAHLNLSVYNHDNRTKLREICSKFIGCLTKAPRPSAGSSAALAAPTQNQIDDWTMHSRRVTFCCTEIKKPKGNLRGYIKDFMFSAGISKANLEAFAFSTKPNVGDEIEACVAQWDNNAQMFNLKAIE